MDDETSLRSAQPASAGRIGRFPSPASIPLFTYGTLLFSEVLWAIIGRVPQGRDTSATGWRVAALKGRTYPGLVSASEEVAHGCLLSGLSRNEWHTLDTFEDSKYELREIDLTCGASGLVYVWVDEMEVCPENWSSETFAVEHLPNYVKRCAARFGRSQAPVSGNPSDGRQPYSS